MVKINVVEIDQLKGYYKSPFLEESLAFGGQRELGQVVPCNLRLTVQ